MTNENNGIDSTETIIENNAVAAAEDQAVQSIVAWVDQDHSEKGEAEYEAAFAAELAAEEAAHMSDEALLGLSEVHVARDMAESEEQALEGHSGEEDEAMDQADLAAIEGTGPQPSTQEAAKPVAEKAATKEKPTAIKNPPAYLAFVAAAEAHAKALGLQVKEQNSFVQFSAASGHKLYVEKALKKSVSRIDTSLPREALVLNGKDISLPLSKPNGRIRCHVDPTIESVKQALEVLASYEEKIPAPKKPAAKAQATV